MSQNTLLFLSAISAGAISFGGALTVALLATPKGEPISSTVWIVCLATGGVSAFKDLRSLLKLPPVEENKNKPNE